MGSACSVQDVMCWLWVWRKNWVVFVGVLQGVVQLGAADFFRA